MISEQSNLLQENQEEMTFAGSILFNDSGEQIFSTSLVHDCTLYNLYKLNHGGVFIEHYIDGEFKKSWLAKTEVEVIGLIGFSDVAKDLYKTCGINANEIIGGSSHKNPDFSKHVIYIENEADLEFVGVHLFGECRKSDYSEHEIIELYEIPGGEVVCIQTDCFSEASNLSNEVHVRIFYSLECALDNTGIILPAEKIDCGMFVSSNAIKHTLSRNNDKPIEFYGECILGVWGNNGTEFSSVYLTPNRKIVLELTRFKEDDSTNHAAIFEDLDQALLAMKWEEGKSLLLQKLRALNYIESA